MSKDKAFAAIFGDLPFVPSNQETYKYVRRYNTTLRDDCDYPFGPVPCTALDPKGPLVSYEDYQKQEQENAALREENYELREAATHIALEWSKARKCYLEEIYYLADKLAPGSKP